LFVFTVNEKNWVVEVTIALMVLCGGSHEGSMLSYGFWLEGFFWSRLVGRLHMILVNIPNHFCGMGLLFLVLNHLESLLSFRLVVGSCMIFVLHSWLWWLLC
jgi:ABC-type spermidine/putrescine transport system permease subunit II